jgi:hypothetical protein
LNISQILEDQLQMAIKAHGNKTLKGKERNNRPILTATWFFVKGQYFDATWVPFCNESDKVAKAESLIVDANQ